MVIYNAQIMFITENEHVCTSQLPRSCWDVMVYHFVLWLCLLKCKEGSTIFMRFSMLSFILTHTNLYGRSLVLSIPM